MQLLKIKDFKQGTQDTLEALEAISSTKDVKFQMQFGFRMVEPISDLTIEQVKKLTNAFTTALATMDDDLSVEPTWNIAEDSKINRDLMEALHAKMQTRIKATNAQAKGANADTGKANTSAKA